jgi:hypothetical protein
MFVLKRLPILNSVWWMLVVNVANDESGCTYLKMLLPLFSWQLWMHVSRINMLVYKRLRALASVTNSTYFINFIFCIGNSVLIAFFVR